MTAGTAPTNTVDLAVVRERIARLPPEVTFLLFLLFLILLVFNCSCRRIASIVAILDQVPVCRLGTASSLQNVIVPTAAAAAAAVATATIVVLIKI